jgi:hypothetical protein
MIQSYKFVNHMVNQGYHAEAILTAFTRLEEAPVKNAWAYASKIVSAESQNMNEAAAIEQNTRHKQPINLLDFMTDASNRMPKTRHDTA